MEGKPSLTIEGSPLLMRNTFKEIPFSFTLLKKEIPYYRRKSLTIEGNALRIKTINSWKSLTIGRSPLLSSNLLNKIPYYRKKPLTILCNAIPYYIRTPLTMEGNPVREISKQTVVTWYIGMNITVNICYTAKDFLKETPYYRRISLTMSRNPLLYNYPLL